MADEFQNLAVQKLRRVGEEIQSLKKPGEFENLVRTRRGEERPELSPEQIQELPELGERPVGFSPELGEGRTPTSKLRLGVQLMTELDDAQIANFVRNEFPEVGVSQIGDAFVIQNNETGNRIVVNKPGLSKLDLLQGLSQVVMFAPAARATQLLTGGAKLATKAAVGGATAAATETVIQAGQEATGGEFTGEDVAIAGGFGAFGEVLAPFIQGVRNIFRARKAGVPRADLEAVPGAVEEAEEATQALAELSPTGEEIGLFRGQKTGVRSTQEKTAFIADLPAFSREAGEAIEKQNEQVFNAVVDVMDAIAPPEVLETGAQRFRSVAQNVIDTKKARRTTQAKRQFNNAFNEFDAQDAPEIDVGDVLDNIDFLAEGVAPGSPRAAAINKARGLIAGSVRPAKSPVAKPKIPERLSVGPTTIRTTPIDTGKPLFRETSVDNLKDLMQPGFSRAFVTDTIDLATGQGLNKGVLVEFKPGFLSGERSLSKPGLAVVPGNEFRLNFIAENAISKITIAPGQPAPTGITRNLLRKQFDRQKLPDGSITYTAKQALDEEVRVGGKGSLRRLHDAKVAIQEDIIEPALEGKKGASAGQAGQEIVEQLRGIMRETSPAYGDALDNFAALSPEIEAIEGGLLGQVSRMSDTQLKNVSQRIFDPQQTNPAIIANAKKIIQDVDPIAWRDITRVEFERRVGAAIAEEAADPAARNLPSQLKRTIFGNAKNRRALLSSVDAETKKNLLYLDTALERAGAGRPGGSPTATREEIKRELRGGFINAIREFIANPLTFTGEIAGDVTFNRRVRAVGKVLYNPEWVPDMAKIRKLSPETPAAFRAMSQLLKQALEEDDDRQDSQE